MKWQSDSDEESFTPKMKKIHKKYENALEARLILIWIT